MAESDIFNRLVSSLPMDERQGLLEKMKVSSIISDEPLYFDSTDNRRYDIQNEFTKLPWFARLWYFILGLFKTSEPSKVFEEDKVSTLGNRIEQISPGLYDSQNAALLPVFFRQIGRLKECSHFLYSALDASVNRDRAGFFAFLASLEMPELHKRLLEETDPEEILKKTPNTPESELRQMASKAMEEAMVLVTEEHRNTMYSNARSLFCLKELSSFLYDRVLLAFSFNSSSGGETCSVGVVRELLVTLNNILFSLKTVPQMTLLESLFIFILQDRVKEPGFDINREIRSLSKKSNDALTFIREFNRTVPLTLILRCSTRDMALVPREISGGEDWYVVFRDYWKKRIDNNYFSFMKGRRQRVLLETFNTFLKGKEVKMLENTQSDANPEGLPIKEAFSLSFLCSFYSVVFMPDLNWILRPILIDGDFERKENRIEYDEAYGNLIKLEDLIKKLEREISVTGDYGKRYAQLRQDMSSLPVKRRKVQLLTDEISEEANVIIGNAREASRSMVNLLGGILEIEARGKYFTLTNLNKIAGKDTGFVTGISKAISVFQTVLKIMTDIEAMENAK